MKYWSSPPHKDEDQTKSHINNAIKNCDEGSSLQLAITLKSNDELIGTLSLFNIHEESRRAEIGYILASSFWGQGIMSEALSSFIKFCFETLQFNRLEADIDPDNQASSKLLKKHGFNVEGLLKERWIVNGKVTDSEIYGLLKSNYCLKTQSK